jgi:hypothetical protein
VRVLSLYFIEDLLKIPYELIDLCEFT